MLDPKDQQCGKMPHYFPGERGWAKLEMTDVEVGVYAKLMPCILLYLWRRVGELKGGASSMARGEDSYVKGSGTLVISHRGVKCSFWYQFGMLRAFIKTQYLKPSLSFKSQRKFDAGPH